MSISLILGARGRYTQHKPTFTLSDIGITIAPAAPAIFSSNQLRSHLLSSGHTTICSVIQLVDGLDNMSGGDLIYLEVFPRIEKRHRLWSEVSRDHKFSALATGSGGCIMSQTAHIIRGEQYGLPRCVGHLVRCWILSLNTVPPGNRDGLAVGAAVWRQGNRVL